MHTRLISIFLFIFFSISSHAQLGIMGGINTSSVRCDNYNNTYGIGFQIGVNYDFRLSNKFIFHPQFLCISESYGKEISIENSKNLLQKEKSNSLGLTVPLLFSYQYPIQINQKLIIDLGPYYSLGLSGKTTFESSETGKSEYDLYPTLRSRSDTGLMGGIGYESNKLIFTAHVKYGLFRVNSEGDKTIGYLFSVGYKFKN